MSLFRREDWTLFRNVGTLGQRRAGFQENGTR